MEKNMMKKSNKKLSVIALIVAVAMTLTAMVAFTGCKGGDTGATTATTATTAPTVAATAAAAQTQDNNAGQAQQSGDVQSQAQQTGSSADSDDGHTINDAWYAGISEQAAGQQVLGSLGVEAMIKNIYPGYYSDGSECWVITIEVTETGDQYNAYVSSDYCYIDGEPDAGHTINDAYYAGISEQAAGQTAIAGLGSDWRITYTSQGQYEGVDCWVVSLTNGESSRTAFVGGDFCYYD